MAQSVYEALSGSECAKLAVRAFANMVAGIPGFNSRLVTFPKLKLTVSIQVEAWERETVERNELLEFTEKAIADGIEHVSMDTHIENFSQVIDETEHPPNELREAIGLPTVHPRRTEQGGIVDAVSLPAGENLSNIVSAEVESPLGPHGGRVIEQAPMTDRAKTGTLTEPTPKLKGDNGVTHFRIRNPNG